MKKSNILLFAAVSIFTTIVFSISITRVGNTIIEYEKIIKLYTLDSGRLASVNSDIVSVYLNNIIVQRQNLIIYINNLYIIRNFSILVLSSLSFYLIVVLIMSKVRKDKLHVEI